jgi:hypothetical protein
MEESSHEGIKGKGKLLLNKKNDALLKSLPAPLCQREEQHIRLADR